MKKTRKTHDVNAILYPHCGHDLTVVPQGEEWCELFCNTCQEYVPVTEETTRKLKKK